jgi:hypothetical protein
MSKVGFTSGALYVWASLLLLAGCGALQAPAGPALPKIAAATLHRNSSSNSTLVYAVDLTMLKVFAYPTGTAVSTITLPRGYANQACSDGQGNVYVLGLYSGLHGQTSTIYEYAHGATAPTASAALSDYFLAAQCSADSTTGNIAVVAGGSGGTELLVYPPGLGKPDVYGGRYLEAVEVPGYDDHGNLFLAKEYTQSLTELPKGKKRLTSIFLGAEFHFVERAMWDGKYLAIESPVNVGRGEGHEPMQMYRVRIRHGTAEAVKIVTFRHLNGRDGAGWLVNNTLLNPASSQIRMSAYPSGKFIGTFATAGKFNHLSSVVLSVGGSGSR